MSIRLKITSAILAMVGVNVCTCAQPLATGTWNKFSVSIDGIYKIDYSLLKKSGINPDQINPQNLQLYSNGNGMLPQPNNSPRQNQLKEIAIFVQGQADGKFDQGDYILFFGQGPDAYHFDTTKGMFSYEHNIYSDKNFYFLTVGSSAGKRLQSSVNQNGSFPVVNQFDDFGYYETDQYNILNSGRDWFGEQFDTNTAITVQFTLPGVVDNTPVKFVSHVMTQSFDAASSFKVYFNDVQILEQDIDPIDNSQYGIKGLEAMDTLVSNSTSVGASGRQTQNVKYQYTPASSGVSIGYLNYFIFSLQRNLALYNHQTIFTSSQSVTNPVSTFEISSLTQSTLIWDITDPFNVQDQAYAFGATLSTFSVATDVLKTFVAFEPDQTQPPTFESQVANQNLSSLVPPDLLIITYPDFMSEAQRLATYRQSQNVSVQTVLTTDIYNEYSGGKQDVTAIRDFVKDVYTRGGGSLDNLLLFGRCSYDYKNRVLSNTNFVPTYESRNSLSPLETYSSDDYFAFLEPNEGEWPENPAVDYSMDIGVGRISVVSLQQAKDVVDKLIDYETNVKRFGSWRKDILFVADDGDDNLHQGSADQLATGIDQSHPEFTTMKIYLDQYKQINLVTGQFSPDAKEAVNRAIGEDGVVIVNYTGHGSDEQWAQEDILDLALIETWKNGPKYPLFVTATCEFGRHDDPFEISSGEQLLLQPGGGGIGLITTARPVNSSSNFQLNNAFYNALFTLSNGVYRDLGSIFRDTKNNSLSGVYNRNFSLIGDPSMHLAFAGNQVVVEKASTIFNSDTLKALSTTMITGEIQKSGTLRTDFNGEAEVTLFDRPASFTTLGDENPPFTYTQWSNVLFRGQASVVAGNFQVECILPINLETDVRQGKLSVYANNGREDANGTSTSNIGGAETTFPPDNTDPDMGLFMGDTTFVNGGIASPNTTLVVKLHDAHGIGITGFGGANNLLATLDDSLNFIINNYYIANTDDYTRGTVFFPINGLQKGKHYIVVGASDTYGNRTSGRVDFVVTEGNLVISEFYNYPNPFSTSSKTTFGFTHNRPGEDLDVELTIFSLTGQILDTEQYSVSASYTTVTLAQWDGITPNGNKLGDGIYLGKLSVRSLLDGSKNQQFTKLIIVN